MDTRVGYATIDVLTTELDNYIKAHVVDNKYIGEVFYLDLYKQYKEYLGGKNETRTT